MSDLGFEVVGPILTKFDLGRAGEIPGSSEAAKAIVKKKAQIRC